MTTQRLNALEKVLEFTAIKSEKKLPHTPSLYFGKRVFSKKVMKKYLDQETYAHVMSVIQGDEKLDCEKAGAIADGMKRWALENNATHYCHWFQPLTGLTAEKHDSFLQVNKQGEVIEKFCGSELIRGEPDASSLPSGGLRNTYEARGYTCWDPTSPAFIWQSGKASVLCIPSVFFSWTGDILDTKIPLMRSEKLMEGAVLRLLKLTGINASRVYSTLGTEQEYFIVDRSLNYMRPDLVMSGRSVFGASPAKGQQLGDHYFARVKDRVIEFMQDLENESLELGIPVKTRHNEVAPAQHELALFFEKASLAVDHNILLMELMKKTAAKKKLTCLLHEKPFANVNGSGKHLNWSLATDTHLNLLDPSETPENNVHFLVLLTAVLSAVCEHADLLRASIATLSNDGRLGGHEAPPAIISVYLGSALESLLDDIEQKGTHKSKCCEWVRLGLESITDLPKHNTDRNRTSAFAFTGNKFEFRAVGSSLSPAFPITVINTIVAKSLVKILEKIDLSLSKNESGDKSLLQSILPILREEIKSSKKVRFSGDNYSEDWKKEAEKRKLPNIPCGYQAYDVFSKKKTHNVLDGVLTQSELLSREEILKEHYLKQLFIELDLMVDLFFTKIIPAAMRYQGEAAQTISMVKSLSFASQSKGKKIYSVEHQEAVFVKVNGAIEKAAKEMNELKSMQKLRLEDLSYSKVDRIKKKMETAREAVDNLELVVDDSKWPLPKYHELLYVL